MRKNFSALLILLTTSTAFASIDQAPPNFPYRDGNAVFVDFQSAEYEITYNVSNQTVEIETEISFRMPVSGFPVFDLIDQPSEVNVDGDSVKTVMVSDPDSASKFRVMDRSFNSGSHRLYVKHSLSRNVSFRSGGVASAFWMSDLEDREYLEQYLPTNLEYDNYPMIMRVEIKGSDQPHLLRANGRVDARSDQSFEVKFPSFYTASSVYFHLSPRDAFPAEKFDFPSVDGRSLPVEVYSSNGVNRYVVEVKKVLAELEKDYGRFPHEKLIVYGAGMGGMEYSGATITDMGAVGHELFHSYNARSVMPAQGNAGWIDEATSSWRDGNYSTRSGPGGTTSMAGHSVWTRMTDTAAYGRGAQFLAWIAGRMEADGKSLKEFYREYLTKFAATTVTTEIFKRELELFSGMDLTPEFNLYIYGRDKGAGGGSSWPAFRKEAGACQLRLQPQIANRYHPKLTVEQQRSLLWPQ